MIEFRTGDMFAEIGPASVLVCPVNTVDVMGAGLALEFARRWPAIRPAYRAACRAGSLDIGLCWPWLAPDGQRVLCLATKVHWRAPSHLYYVSSGLVAFAGVYGKRTALRFVFPALGCGLGGLSADAVRAEMVRILGPLEAQCVAYNVGGVNGENGE